jgi:hypothetical protein
MIALGKPLNYIGDCNKDFLSDVQNSLEVQLSVPQGFHVALFIFFCLE